MTLPDKGTPSADPQRIVALSQILHQWVAQATDMPTLEAQSKKRPDLESVEGELDDFQATVSVEIQNRFGERLLATRTGGYAPGPPGSSHPRAQSGRQASPQFQLTWTPFDGHQVALAGGRMGTLGFAYLWADASTLTLQAAAAVSDPQGGVSRVFLNVPPDADELAALIGDLVGPPRTQKQRRPAEPRRTPALWDRACSRYVESGLPGLTRAVADGRRWRWDPAELDALLAMEPPERAVPVWTRNILKLAHCGLLRPDLQAAVDAAAPELLAALIDPARPTSSKPPVEGPGAGLH